MNGPRTGPTGAAMTASGVQSFSYAPIRFGDTTLGVLAVGAVGQGLSDAHLPAMTELGSAASALLALHLQAERLTSHRRAEIESVMERHAYFPVFQPIVQASSGQVRGYEALIRFRDGERPDIRISTAWSVGLGNALELAVLEPAIEMARRLPHRRWLAVNVSPRLLDDPEPLRAILGQADRPLVVEITEHEVILNYRAVREALSRLGPVRTAVDDAGAGIANFAHIVELRPNLVKLDIGLVRASTPTRPARRWWSPCITSPAPADASSSPRALRLGTRPTRSARWAWALDRATGTGGRRGSRHSPRGRPNARSGPAPPTS